MDEKENEAVAHIEDNPGADYDLDLSEEESLPSDISINID